MLKKTALFIIASFSLCLLMSCSAPNLLKKGEKAPLFTAEASHNGKEMTVSLKKDLAKGPVVLYFFPSAYTMGCDREAHAFATLKKKFEAQDATIIGVSADNLERLNDFSADSNYCAGQFPVVSDPDGKLGAKYGVPISSVKKNAKDVRGVAINHGFLARTTFVIDTNGIIVATFSTKRDLILPKKHASKALEEVKEL